MALPQELFDTPAYKLTTFVQQCLHPSREWKEEVLEVVRTVEYSLRKKCFQRKSRLDKEVWVQKVIKVGSLGNGTMLGNTTEVELVVFLSCFRSFQEEAKHHQRILNLIYEKLLYCQDLLALQLQDLRLVQGAPCEVVSFTVQTRETGEPITVTLVPAFGALELYLHKPQPPPEVYVSLIKACNVPGNFSPSFSELQKNFIKHRPAKLKSLLRLVKHWYLESARDIQVTVEQCGYPDLTLTVNPYKLIKEIKEEIQETLGSSAVLRLSFQEPSGERQLLRSRDYLASYGIFSNTRICLLETVPPEIQLFVKNPSGWSHSYAVDPNSLILDLKQQIEEKEELFREEQQLEFQGQVLQDWWRLGICGFQDSDTLILSKKKAGEAQFLPR
ncbi:2'-5'-oligoadenylate synthase-like protein isoform X3 [Camelus ferus]|uniref:2'-5'-oligoadenylate synthase-like protein isoform X3 n=2 Tax=Camelus TaxID=9836 RepID=A0A8B8SDC8_CAMFR|nr:2'-5'-oligoadenylate synthase-like protein isoform X3 [Camelus ferus]